MALKGVIVCGFILCIFGLGSAKFCTVDSDCDTWSGESCCSDSVCRKTCSYCYSDSDCGTDEVCCNGGDCLSACPWSSRPRRSMNGSTGNYNSTAYRCSFDSNCDTDEVCCGGDCLSVCPSTWTGASIVGAVIGTIVFFSIIISILACYFCTWCPYYRYRSPGNVRVSQLEPYQPFVSTTHMTMSSMQHIPPPAYPSYPLQPAQHPPPPAPAAGQLPMAPKVSA